MKPISGIYLITNKITGQQYIGQSVDCFRRYTEHCNRNKLLIDKIIKKFGRENFSFKIIKRCPKCYLDIFETYYIKKYNTFNCGYNEKINKKKEKIVDKILQNKN